MTELLELQDLVSEAETFEFPYCDLAHEDVVRDAHDTILTNAEGRSKLEKECPIMSKLKRPGCAHCREQRALDESEPEGAEDGDILLQLSRSLQSLLGQHKKLIKLTIIYEQQVTQLDQLDADIRKARTGGTVVQQRPAFVPSKEEAERLAEPLIKQHRTIVDSMKTFRDFLVEMARPLMKKPYT